MAVGLGAIVGPSQVGARVVEMMAGRITIRSGRWWVDGLGGGRYLNVIFRLSSLRRRGRIVRRRKWHSFHRSWDFAARAVRTVAIPGTDGPSRPADINIDGSVSFRWSNCFPHGGPNLLFRFESLLGL